MKTAEEFFARVEKTESCWLWTGTLDVWGYGKCQWATDSTPIWLAHRASYVIAHGSIPAGLELDHLCRVRRCVNPDHLEPVTKLENWRRGNSLARINADKTHCLRGHEFNEENTRVRPGRRRGKWRRFCRTCDRIRQAEFQARKRLADAS